MKRMLFLFIFLACLLSLSLTRGQTPPDNATDKDADKKAGERTVLKINGIDYAFRWCPDGSFRMGSPQNESNRDDDETQHKVTLSRGFYMLETEVTQAMWASVMGDNSSQFEGMKRPVEMVSWGDCQQYVKKLNDLGVAPKGYRFSLPTEAQWEYACRAGTTTAYHFGDTLEKSKANFDNNQTVDVASYPANAWGLYDMHGNVYEWCLDWYGKYPDGTAVTDPAGPSEGSHRVFRGGDWFNGAKICRSALRGHFDPSYWSSRIGVRLSLVSEK